jgi:hypothetical protein
VNCCCDGGSVEWNEAKKAIEGNKLKILGVSGERVNVSSLKVFFEQQDMVTNPIQFSSSISIKPKTDIFLSLRFAEALPFAKLIQKELQKRNYSTFLAAIEVGNNIAKEVISNIFHCRLVVILGTRTYGKKTLSSCSTFEELQFIKAEEKTFYLIKMCEEFEEYWARFLLVSDISHYKWIPTKESSRLPLDW